MHINMPPSAHYTPKASVTGHSFCLWASSIFFLKRCTGSRADKGNKDLLLILTSYGCHGATVLLIVVLLSSCFNQLVRCALSLFSFFFMMHLIGPSPIFLERDGLINVEA
jgi:hypothetical protein